MTTLQETIALEGVGRRLGGRDGAGPDDHPFLRSFRDESRAEGKAEGFDEGFGKGFGEGFGEGRAKTIRRCVLARGIEVSAGFPADVPGFAEASEEAAVAAALACGSERTRSPSRRTASRLPPLWPYSLCASSREPTRKGPKCLAWRRAASQSTETSGNVSAPRPRTASIQKSRTCRALLIAASCGLARKRSGSRRSRRRGTST